MTAGAVVAGGPGSSLDQSVATPGLDEAELARARASLEQAHRAIDLFLANMSHELRTPMTSVIGATELLLESRLDADQRSMLEDVRRSGKLLLRLINDVLDYSKIEAGKYELYVRDFDLHATIRTAFEAFRSTQGAQGLSLSLGIDPDVPRWARGDSLRLEQVISNLLDNAIKFTESGTVRLSVSVEDGGPRIRFCVSDTGPGFAKEQTARLFEPFAQGGPSSSRRYGGTGLGLAIARQLVELMQGEIGAESVPGWGSHFRFAVDLPPGSEQAARRQSGGIPRRCLSPVPRRAGAERRILLAEDNELNQLLVRRALEALECVVDSVRTGADAVEAVSSGAYGLVIMDCQMPDMDGFEASQEIRRRQKDTRIPIIALTANAMIGDRDKCLAAGMDDYIAKPFSLGVLRRKLKRWLADPAVVVPDEAEAVEETPVELAVDLPTDAVVDDLPTVDVRRLAALREEAGSEIVQELATIFLQDMRVRLARLERAARSGDTEQLEQSAHAIKGAAGNIGAMQMAQIAESIEGSAVDGELAVASIRAIRAEFKRVRAVLMPRV